MVIVSIINYKGGVGKTTITANIAAELAYRGKNVLTVDLDPQANLTFSFITVDEWRKSYQESMTIKSWYDSFIDHGVITDPSNLIIRPDRVNDRTKGALDLICSHLGLINVDLELAVMLGGTTPRQHRNNFLKVYSLLFKGLQLLLKSTEERYDVVLIDCPPNFNIVTKNALVSSNYYMVPAKPDYLSTLGIEQLNRHVEELIKDYNNFTKQVDDDYEMIKPQLLGIIFTMLFIKSGKPILAQEQYIEHIKRTGLPIFDTLIRENKTAYADAPEYGVPVVLNSASGQTYINIRTELEDLAEEFQRKVGI